MGLLKHSHLFVVSDLHLGDPNSPLEDFHQDKQFRSFLLEIIPKQAKSKNATLIIAGDFIDFPQVLPNLGKESPGDTWGTTEPESVQKMEIVLQGHPLVFDALQTFLSQGNQVLVLPGNHDIDLCWDKVFSLLRKRVGGYAGPQLHYVTEGYLDEGEIYIEHGNQYAFDNQFDNWPRPILEDSTGVSRLERCWGTFFLDTIYNDLEASYPFLDNVQPWSLLTKIVLRMSYENPKPTLSSVARLLAFFLKKGKRFTLGHLLLGEEEIQEDLIAQTDIENMLSALHEGLETNKYSHQIETLSKEIEKKLASESGSLWNKPTKLLGGGNEADPNFLEAEGLLGETDERGLEKRTRELFRLGKKIVVFGHTHHPIDGNAKKNQIAEFEEYRMFNTGTWVSQIDIPRGIVPSPEEIKTFSCRYDLRYLWIQRQKSTASLEVLYQGLV